jgi:hypothetical protein
MLRIRLPKIAKAPHRLDPALMSTPIVPKTPAWKAVALAALLGLATAPRPGPCRAGERRRHRAGALRRAAQHDEERPHARAERALHAA